MKAVKRWLLLAYYLPSHNVAQDWWIAPRDVIALRECGEGLDQNRKTKRSLSGGRLCGQKRSHVLHWLDQNKTLNSPTNIRNVNVT